jgi:polysaccharide deacetylase family protein (PEP-CTERM system associated)
MINILTVDLEDWFQSSLELFDGIRDREGIVRPTGRVVRNARTLLSILEKYGTRATFFVLGTVAESFPGLISEICGSGHEIATHGYSHKLVYKQTKEEFREDLRRSLHVIESITGDKVWGYRAPYFSITEDSLWALKILREEGLKYDASIFPLKRKLYGVRDIDKINIDKLIELPASKISFLGYKFPFAGGGYLRMFPYVLTKWAIKKLNRQKKPAMVYIHPYEIDTENLQECVLERNVKSKWTMYTQNLNRAKTICKIKALLRDFEFTTIKDYLASDQIKPYLESL